MRGFRIFRLLTTAIFLIACVCLAGFKFYYGADADMKGPRINVPQGAIEVSVAGGEEAMLAGITAEDETDGDVSDTLFIEKTAHFSDENTRTITVAAHDKSGNLAHATREVVYTDYHKPHFSLTKGLRFPVGTTSVLDNMHAECVLDGDISKNIKSSGRYTMDRTEGEYLMEFSVANSAGDISYVTATVTLYEQSTENASPQITLTDYLVYADANNKVDPWKFIESLSINRKDYVRSGNKLVPEHIEEIYAYMPEEIAKSEVHIKNDVDYTTPGSYEITYTFNYNDYTGKNRLIVIVE